MTIRKYKFQGITLEIDDENADTPAMVIAGNHSSTYDAATATGEVGDDANPYALTENQLIWLEAPGNVERVNMAFDKARAGNPDYQ